ncbi:hypothetical protein D9M70_553710 [compost metagenome]
MPGQLLQAGLDGRQGGAGFGVVGVEGHQLAGGFVEHRLQGLDVMGAGGPAGGYVDQQLAAAAGQPAGHQVDAAGLLVGRDQHGRHAPVGDPLVESPVVLQPHQRGDALYAMVEALPGVLLAQLQGVAQVHRLHPFPLARSHWKRSRPLPERASKQI